LTKYVALNEIGTFQVSDGSSGYWTTYADDTYDGLWIKTDGSDQGSWNYDDGATDSGYWWNESNESGTWTQDDTDPLLKNITTSTEEQYDGSWMASDGE
jgi:hypothetical protein